MGCEPREAVLYPGQVTGADPRRYAFAVQYVARRGASHARPPLYNIAICSLFLRSNGTLQAPLVDTHNTPSLYIEPPRGV